MTIADIKFDCAQCGQSILVEADAAGRTAECPMCNGPVTIPTPDSIHESQSIAPPRERTRVRSAAGPQWEQVMPAAREKLPESMDAHPQNGRSGSEAADRLEAARLREKLAAVQSECERLSANATHAQAEIKTFQTERLALKTDLGQWKQRVTALEAQLASKEEALAQRIVAAERSAAERAGIENELVAMRRELAAARSELAMQRNAVAAHVASLEKQRSALQKTRDALAAVQTERQSLTAKCKTLRREKEALRRSMTKTKVGKELAATRASLAIADEDRSKLRQSASQLASDLSGRVEECERLGGSVSHLRVEIEEASRKIEAMAEDQIRQDNEVLRGIVARQNAELEIRHRDIVRLKRAKVALKLVYGVFALGLLGLGYLAMAILRGLQF